MADVLIIARFNASRFHTLDELETAKAHAQANKLFGDGENAPADEVNWVYIGTPNGGHGGWTAIITGESYNNFSRLLRGPLSKMYDFEIYFLNRTYSGGVEGEASTIRTMVPANSHSW
jgi:hypothetical protein